MGEKSKEADAEIISFAIDIMRSMGFTNNDFVIRLSDREVWLDFLNSESISEDSQESFLQTIDKLERQNTEKTQKDLQTLGTSLESVNNFINTNHEKSHFHNILDNLKARGLSDFVKIDLNVVRGLAYYTGTVFEVFDTKKNMRAVAGGGRYDKLCSVISDGATDIPACGFAMGDVVISDLIKSTKAANSKLLNHLAVNDCADVYLVIADENKRTEAIQTLQELRNSGYKTVHSLTQVKVAKQFTSAENLKARTAIIIGREFPEVTVKDLFNKTEQVVNIDDISKTVETIIKSPLDPPLFS